MTGIPDLVKTYLLGEETEDTSEGDLEIGSSLQVDGQPAIVTDIDVDTGIVTVEFPDGEMADVELVDHTQPDPAHTDLDVQDKISEVFAPRKRMIRAGRIAIVKARTLKRLTPAQKAARRRQGQKLRGRKVKIAVLRARRKSNMRRDILGWNPQ